LPVIVGEGANVGPRAVLLPGANIGAGASVAPGRVVSFRLPPGTDQREEFESASRPSQRPAARVA
jgi:hypothetical protein